MKTRLLAASLAVAFVTLAAATSFAKGNPSPPVKEIPATSTLSNAPFNIQSDQVGPEGTYPNSQTVRSVVAEDWILDTQPSLKVVPTRSVLIDFSDPVLGTGPGGSNPISPFPGGVSFGMAHARFIAKCHENGVHVLDIPVNTTATCPLAIALRFGNGYGIIMDPLRHADTEPVKFACTRPGTSPSQCSEWTISPFSLDTPGKSIGKLIGPPTGTGPNSLPQDMGNFRFSFSIKVSVP